MAGLEYIGISQYGDVYKIRSKYPLKDLLIQTGYKTSKKMYIDDKENKPKHIGYVLALRGFNTLWITIYKVSDFK